MSRLIDADALIADCQLAQKQADRHGREFANAFYSGGGEISTEWWCVEDMIENAPTIEERKKGKCVWCDSPYRIEYYWIDREGCTASFQDEERHMVATGIAKFCPNCGRELRGEQR